MNNFQPNEALPDDETVQNLKENSLWTDGYPQAPITRDNIQNQSIGYPNQDKSQQGFINQDRAPRIGRGTGRGARGGRGGQQTGGMGRTSDKPQTVRSTSLLGIFFTIFYFYLQDPKKFKHESRSNAY